MASRTGKNSQRSAAATIICTTIERYDFFIFSTAAALVFPKVFFEPAGPVFGSILSFALVGISFLFRPLGAFLAGHYGDRIGRRAMLVVTLILMGASTSLIGLLPTFEQVGIWAPILLMFLRVLQGISAGGEWGGAVLMAVEHAAPDRRGRAGAFPQMGVPLGLLLASGVNALMTGTIAPGAAYVEWGWRIPFLLSVVLIVVGYVVRRAVDESPVFQEMKASSVRVRVPAVELFRKHGLLVVIAALIFAGNNAAGYMATGGFIPSYATSPAVGLQRTDVLLAVAYGSLIWMIFTALAGYLADKIGRKTTYLLGFGAQLLACFPFFWMLASGSLGLLYLGMTIFAVGLGLAYGPQAALYAEMFPASVRFSGVSISYALGAIVGGAFAPLIATALVQNTGSINSVATYILGMTVVSIIAVLLVRDRSGIDLSPSNQAQQEVGALIFDHRTPAATVPPTVENPAAAG